jgi:hypothetical protein
MDHTGDAGQAQTIQLCIAVMTAVDLIPTTALQLPWVGRALNWQGQPYEQLQLANSRPRMIHCVGIARSAQGRTERWERGA